MRKNLVRALYIAGLTIILLLGGWGGWRLCERYSHTHIGNERVGNVVFTDVVLCHPGKEVLFDHDGQRLEMGYQGFQLRVHTQTDFDNHYRDPTVEEVQLYKNHFGQVPNIAKE